MTRGDVEHIVAAQINRLRNLPLGLGGLRGIGSGANEAAPGTVTTADALVKTATTALPNARVVTNTSSVTWDFSTPGQAKATVASGGGSPLTTKGDVYGYSTTNARVPVGSNGQVLTADSTQALGVKWATPVDTGLTQLTGDVTAGPGSGSQAATIAPQAVTVAKATLSATQRLFGRNTAGSGAAEEVTAAQVLDWIGSTRGMLLARGASAWSALTLGTAGQVLRAGSTDPAWSDGLDLFGDGSDGAIDFDGASTITLASGATIVPSGSVYTVPQDICATTFRTRANVRVDWGGFFPYGNGVATFDDAVTSVWSRNGGNASGTTAGTGVSGGTLGSTSTSGGAGVSALADGSSPGGMVQGLGARGGGGGNAGGKVGGASGTLAAPAATAGSRRTLAFLLLGCRLHNVGAWQTSNGGSGGGGGACNPGAGTASSGAGGGGAGVLVAFLRYVSGAGIIEANGGNGSAAVFTGVGTAGGGGGGGGGYVALVTSSPTVSVTLRANGGAFGAGANGGSVGVAGGAGQTLTVRV